MSVFEVNFPLDDLTVVSVSDNNGAFAAIAEQKLILSRAKAVEYFEKYADGRLENARIVEAGEGERHPEVYVIIRGDLSLSQDQFEMLKAFCRSEQYLKEREAKVLQWARDEIKRIEDSLDSQIDTILTERRNSYNVTREFF